MAGEMDFRKLVAIAAPTGKLLSLNAEGRQLCGLEADAPLEDIGLVELFTPTHRQTVADTIISATVNDGLWEGVLELAGPDNESIPVSAVFINNCDNDGLSRYLTIVLNDLRVLRKQEQQSQQATAFKEKVDELVHEMNNRLQVLLISSELAGANLGDEQRQYHLQKTADSAEQIAELCRQLTTTETKKPADHPEQSVSERESFATADVASDGSRHSSRGRVLVVEDEDVARDALARILASRGFEVISANNPIEALLRIESLEDELDLCVTDVVMSPMTGWQFANKLKKRFPDTPILYVSGYAQDHRGTDKHPDDKAGFLSKPFSAEQLLESAEELIRVS